MELKQKASTTGFRILFILDMLLRKPYSKDEILSAISSNPDISNITKETLSLDINTLKSAGFKIENTNRANNYKYKINASPIKISLTKEEVRSLVGIRDAVLEFSNLDYILKLYIFFKKITKLIDDNDVINELLNFEPLLNVDFEILKELLVLSARKKEVLLLYNSPSEGKKEIKIKLKEIKYSNSRLHITGFSNYPDKTVLRPDRVLKVVKILNPDDILEIKKSKTKSIIYKVSSEIKDLISLLNEEKVLKEGKKFIQIEMKTSNDFMAIQRLLSFGENLIDIKNKDIKEKYINTLKAVERNYGEKV